jgi:hypothetical protein
MKLTSRNRAHHLPSPNSPPAVSSLPSSTPIVLPSPVDQLSFTKSPSCVASEGNHDNRDDKDSHYHKFSRQSKPHLSLMHFAQRLWYQWKLLKTYSKIVAALIYILLLQHLVLRLWDRCFYRTGILDSRSSNSKSTEEYFAVVINTYKRPDMLRQAVQHYADTCGKKYKVGQVFVVWAQQGVQVPTPQSFFDDNKSLRTGSMTGGTLVEVLQVSKDSLNSRFEPIPQLTTTSVFMVDDDIRVACPSLLLGFQAWKENPDSMAGYYPRLSAPPISQSKDAKSTTKNKLIYHTWPVVYWRQKLNFVLTKASFLHSKYLSLYTNDETYPREIKDHVDRHMNCEDIAMSMLVANYTKHQYALLNKKKDNVDSQSLASPPVYVEGKVSDWGLFGGISTGSGHMLTRSDCLTQLTAIFESKGWGSPLQQDYDLGQSSYVRHAPGFWWQSKPSNFFEWLSFANILT